MSSRAEALVDRSAPVFAALGDPTRLAIVARLSGEGPLSIARLTEGTPVRLASAISLSVPQLQPTATTASAARTSRPLRSSPRPVGSVNVFSGAAPARSGPGSSPIAVPPASLAPRAAACITPFMPPVSTTAPRSASPRPTARAVSRSPARAESLGPTTAT